MRWLNAGLSLALLLVLTACGKPALYTQESYVFGTRVEISIYGESEHKAKRVAAQVLGIFDRMHHDLHAWEPGRLSTLNDAFSRSQQPIAINPEMSAIIEDAARYSLQSKGLFNPAIGNLIRLWGFQSDQFQAKLPDTAAISALVAAHPRMGDIVIDDNRAYSRNPAVRVDLGGYAKGYALDIAAAYLHTQGIRNALINIGGNIMALGQHGDRPWRVGIQNPRKPGPIATLDLHDGEAIGTSGDYQRFFELNGKRYCHIIDPRTGWPAQGVEAVTVLIQSRPHAGTLSDVASKPLFIAGPTGWRYAAEQMGVTAAMLIDAEGKVHLTSAMQKRLNFDTH